MLTLTFVIHSRHETFYLLNAIDEYNRFPAHSTIPKLDIIFSMNGIPEVEKLENEYPFQSSEF